MKKTALTALSLLFAFTLAACGKKESPPPPAVAPPAGMSVSAVTLGKAVGPDKKVTAPADSFAKGDTIYASVDTQGSGTAALRAKWTYHKGDKSAPVNEATQTIVTTGPATSEFHVSKPDGWPAGDYQVEIFLNEQSAGSKRYSVK